MSRRSKKYDYHSLYVECKSNLWKNSNHSSYYDPFLKTNYCKCLTETYVTENGKFVTIKNSSLHTWTPKFKTLF